MIPRGKLECHVRKQDNDCGGFRGSSKSNKSAKRLSSKRMRRILKSLVFGTQAANICMNWRSFQEVDEDCP